MKKTNLIDLEVKLTLIKNEVENDYDYLVDEQKTDEKSRNYRRLGFVRRSLDEEHDCL